MRMKGAFGQNGKRRFSFRRRSVPGSRENARQEAELMSQEVLTVSQNSLCFYFQRCSLIILSPKVCGCPEWLKHPFIWFRRHQTFSSESILGRSQTFGDSFGSDCAFRCRESRNEEPLRQTGQYLLQELLSPMCSLLQKYQHPSLSLFFRFRGRSLSLSSLLNQ